MTRTIPNIKEKIGPLEYVISYEFIPAITGGYQCSDIETDLFALPPRLGSFGINIFSNDSEVEYPNS